MPNTYFEFKQFIVHQEHCAMKVSTEACILGAWVKKREVNRILDIGTGTGLLSLMLAQRIDGQIDAVEMDSQAAEQAGENVRESKWSDRIIVVQADIFDYANKVENTYDLIISNPPFFTNSQKSEAIEKNKAKHDTEAFDKSRLAKALSTLLTVDGRAYILYPEHESKQFKEIAMKQGLFCKDSLIIRNQPDGAVFRVITAVSKKDINMNTESLNIRDGANHSDQFNALLRPYYLKL